MLLTTEFSVEVLFLWKSSSPIEISVSVRLMPQKSCLLSALPGQKSTWQRLLKLRFHRVCEAVLVACDQKTDTVSFCRPVCVMQAQQMSKTRLWYSAQSWSHTWSLQASSFDSLAPSHRSVKILPTQLYLSNQKETSNVYTSRPVLYQWWDSSRSLMNWF